MTKETFIELLVTALPGILTFIVALSTLSIARKGVDTWQKQTKANIDRDISEKLFDAWIVFASALIDSEVALSTDSSSYLSCSHSVKTKYYNENIKINLEKIRDSLERSIENLDAAITKIEFMKNINYPIFLQVNEDLLFGRKMAGKLTKLNATIFKDANFKLNEKPGIDNLNKILEKSSTSDVRKNGKNRLIEIGKILFPVIVD